MFAHNVPSTDFMKAGDLAVVKQYIAENAANPAAINQADKFGRTAIFVAASNGHAHIVAELLKVSELDVLDDNLLRLMPPDDRVRSQVKLSDMKVSDAQVAIFYRQCKEYKDNPPQTISPQCSLADEEDDLQNPLKKNIERVCVNDGATKLGDLKSRKSMKSTQ